MLLASGWSLGYVNNSTFIYIFFFLSFFFSLQIFDKDNDFNGLWLLFIEHDLGISTGNLGLNTRIYDTTFTANFMLFNMLWWQWILLILILCDIYAQAMTCNIDTLVFYCSEVQVNLPASLRHSLMIACDVSLHYRTYLLPLL